VRRSLDSYQAAIVIFHYENNQGLWRFSFIHKGGSAKDTTQAKRYSYLCGKGYSCRTAGDRFRELEQIEEKKSIEQVVEAFSIEKLTEQFYKEIFEWYQWAVTLAEFPNKRSAKEGIELTKEGGDLHIIRLITRLIFVWFLKQIALIPNEIFTEEHLYKILSNFSPDSDEQGTYYNGILQNLFFATLNREILDNEGKPNRYFAVNEPEFSNQSYPITNLFRDNKGKSYFSCSHQEILRLFEKVPFLNGGLFECLDKWILDDEKLNHGTKFYHEGFSREASRRAFVPDVLFWGKTREKEGIIHILNKYNFTIEENTPSDVEIALDPELLGKVFENLLGYYDNNTKEMARKSSGSFYTPREIVNYMTDESLLSFFMTKIPELSLDDARYLFSDNYSGDNDRINGQKSAILTNLKNVKIIDPACGSGAFPLGIINRLVDIIEKLEPPQSKTDTYKLKMHLIENCIYGVDIQPIAVQIAKLRVFISLVCEQERNNDIEHNYGIETLPNLETKFVAANSLIGISGESSDMLDMNDSTLLKLKDDLWDIRKKHFYIKNSDDKKALEKEDKQKRNEIIAYLLKKAAKPDEDQIKFFEEQIEILKEKRLEYTAGNFIDEKERQGNFDFVQNPKPDNLFQVDKNKPIRDLIDDGIDDFEKKIAIEKKKGKSAGLEREIESIANWDPYDQNEHSLFFDREWMFGLARGFDIVIGNPPYGAKHSEEEKKYYIENYISAKTIKSVQKGSTDSFSLFIEQGYNLLAMNGHLNFIVPIAITSSDSMTGIQRLLEDNCSAIKISSYSVRPQPIFTNAVVNTSIISFQKDDRECANIFCTKMYRKNKNFNLEHLLKNLKFIDIHDVKLYGRYPKISDAIEKKILKKILAFDMKIGNLIKDGGKAVFYRTTGGRYFKIITNYPTGSTKERPLYFDKNIADTIGAILSSNLFFWYYQIISNNLDLKMYEIASFGIPIEKFTKSYIKNIEKAYSVYLKDIEKNVNIRKTDRYANVDSFKEYKIYKSKHLIDKIDDIICPLYGLTKEETDFIKNYEIEFRVAEE
jgi:hypothetical protein